MTLESAWVYGPVATDQEVEVARKASNERKGVKPADDRPAPWANAFNIRNAPSTPCPASDMLIPPPGSMWTHNSTGITYKAGQVSFAINSKEFTEVKREERKPKVAKTRSITLSQQAKADEDAAPKVGQVYLHGPSFKVFIVTRIGGGKITLRYRLDQSAMELTDSEFRSGAYSKLH